MSDETPTRFDPLPAALQTHLQHQRALIAARVAASFPTLPVQWPLAASTLQRVVDAELIDRDDCGGWEALGVAFGDTLAQRVPGLAWMQVTDAWGIDAVLRHADSNLQIGAGTLLLKRGGAGRGHRHRPSAGVAGRVRRHPRRRLRLKAAGHGSALHGAGAAWIYSQRPSTTTRRCTGTPATAAGP